MPGARGSESWYVKHHDRPPTPAQSRRAALAAAVAEAFEASGGTYGSPQVSLKLRAAEWRVSVNTVAQLMRERGLIARVVRRRRSVVRGQVAGLIFHSDRGSEYTAANYAAACGRFGVMQSMGRVASALDNAAAKRSTAS